MENFWKEITLATAPILATLVAAVLVQLLRRLGLEVGAEKEAKLDYLVRQGILRAEEWAAKEAKERNVVTSEEKLTHAVTAVQERAPKLSTAEVVDRVHAQLPALNLGATAPTPVPLPPCPPTAA